MLKNYYQPTPKNFRILGDFFLVLIPVLQTIFATAPGMSDAAKFWWGSGCTVGLVIGKFLTNLAKEEETSKPDVQ